MKENMVNGDEIERENLQNLEIICAIKKRNIQLRGMRNMFRRCGIDGCGTAGDSKKIARHQQREHAEYYCQYINQNYKMCRGCMVAFSKKPCKKYGLHNENECIKVIKNNSLYGYQAKNYIEDRLQIEYLQEIKMKDLENNFMKLTFLQEPQYQLQMQQPHQQQQQQLPLPPKKSIQMQQPPQQQSIPKDWKLRLNGYAGQIEQLLKDEKVLKNIDVLEKNKLDELIESFYETECLESEYQDNLEMFDEINARLTNIKKLQ